MSNYVLNIFSVLCGLFIFLFFTESSLEQKSNKQYVVMVISIFIKTISINQVYPQINLLLSIILYYIILKSLYKITLLNSMLIILFFISTSILAEHLSFLLIKVIYPIKSVYMWQISIIPWIGIFVARILHFLIIKLINNVVSVKNFKNIKKKQVMSFIILPLSTVFVILSLFNWVDEAKSTNYFFVLAILGLLISNLFFYKIYFENIEKLRIESELKIQKERREYDQVILKQIKESELELRRFKHDAKKNYELLYFFVSMGNLKKAKNFINELTNQIDLSNNIATGNIVYDAIISLKMNKISKNGIKLNSEIENVNWVNIQVVDINIILANIIDNAIESCKHSIAKSIRIIIVEKNANIIIKVINSCDKVNISEDGSYVSIKKDGLSHGHGLINIKKCVQNYNGFSSFSFNKDKRIFISTVILPVSQVT